jgi:hypothetical protein
MGATPLPDPTSKALWATIDVCDAAAHTIGIRGSMPGTADARELLYMSFRVEYRGRAGEWHYLARAGQSPFVLVGDGAAVARQAGQNFQIARTKSARYVLRGVVIFEWRLHGHTVASNARATRAGHTAAAGADPPGFSAATCGI